MEPLKSNSAIIFEDKFRGIRSNMIQYGLPNSFHDWEFSNHRNVTIAHLAAHYGKLTNNFNLWNLATKDTGWTVAHEAAKEGTLLSSFDQWDLTDNYGTTVAEVAAKFNNLPKNFDKHHLITKKNFIIDDITAISRRSSDEIKIIINQISDQDEKKRFIKRREQKMLSCKYHYYKKRILNKKPINEEFNEWHLHDPKGYTLAHLAAEYGCLPHNFNQWDLTDNYGTTVRDIINNNVLNKEYLTDKLPSEEFIVRGSFPEQKSIDESQEKDFDGDVCIPQEIKNEIYQQNKVNISMIELEIGYSHEEEYISYVNCFFNLNKSNINIICKKFKKCEIWIFNKDQFLSNICLALFGNQLSTVDGDNYKFIFRPSTIINDIGKQIFITKSDNVNEQSIILTKEQILSLISILAMY